MDGWIDGWMGGLGRMVSWRTYGLGDYTCSRVFVTDQMTDVLGVPTCSRVFVMDRMTDVLGVPHVVGSLSWTG